MEKRNQNKRYFKRGLSAAESGTISEISKRIHNEGHLISFLRGAKQYFIRKKYQEV